MGIYILGSEVHEIGEVDVGVVPLFVISMESVASPYCNAEIVRALHHERRIVTVLYPQSTSKADTLHAIDSVIDSIPDGSVLPSSVSVTITNLRSLTRRNWLEISKVPYVAFTDEYPFCDLHLVGFCRNTRIDIDLKL
ncbi:MAG: hypothetical protein GX573_15110 [Chloroflexi bacterium]|nr:hypothetical protein [Chloroflexota bacterium]